jgi:hypothetical protein
MGSDRATFSRGAWRLGSKATGLGATDACIRRIKQ